MPIHEGALLQELAVNMIMQAAKDLKKKRDPARALSALLWLADDDFEIWATAAGADSLNPFKMLAMGGAKKLR